MSAAPVPGVPPTLEAIDVSRRYGRRWALRKVNAAFQDGSLTAVLGDNGAGKSTFLQILAGVIRPSEGEVRVFDTALDAFPPREVRLEMALLGHQPGIYPDLTGAENLTFFQRFYGRPSADPAAILARVGLAEAASRPARTYSRGMVQRLALGRLIVQNARLWLLDEPSTGLDARGALLLGEVLGEAKDRGATIVAVTHDLAALGPAVDRVLRFVDGRLAA